jgi:multidrug efflux pump subunit AcrA (membrane-fusion protein)
MKKEPLKIISLMAVASVLLSACAAEKTLDFSASGTFSAIETTLAPEISGKVVEVSVNEGDEVEVGQTLFKIDDEVIRAQYDQAVAARKSR